jgi:ketosteroid isomerase-like protein
MVKFCLSLFLFCVVHVIAEAQSRDEKEVRRILKDQTEWWNKGNLDEFVSGYWRNDSLMFIRKSGVAYGFQNTLNSYKKNYSDTAKMGKLSFDIIDVKHLSPEYYFVVGKWFLQRTVGDLSGHFTLLFRKIKGRWYIIADHSS